MAQPKKNFRSKHKHKHKSKHNHNHNHKNHKHRFQIYIFPFKITIQTQISNLWFSFFPFRNHKHKHKHKFTWLRWTEPRKKEKRKKNGDSTRSATARMKQSWDLREMGTARTKLHPSLLKSVGTARTVLPSVENESPASSCLMSSWCSSCYTYDLWPCMWDRWEMKRWEAVSERLEEMRGVRGWNEERNWKFRVLTLYIYMR